MPDVFKATALEHISSYADHATWYTDGSKTADGVGCAFVCGSTVRSFTLPEYASVFTSELMAITKLLCFIEISDEVYHLILSDSLSCLLTIRSFYPSHPLVREISHRLTVLARTGKEITLCWIPSHVGINGNELADAAAKRAAQRPCTRRLPLPARDFYPAISSLVRKNWQEAWEQSRGSKLFALKPKISPWRSSLRKSRREEVILCRLRIGHTHATHGYLLCGAQQPACPRCGARLSVRHVLLDCPQLEEERRRHLCASASDLSLACLLGDNSDFIDGGRLFSFISAAGLSVIYTPR